ncbi:GWxTD domain-containing protein [Melioribacteraceae bacterium 4301-Me]|uniref:GWxTD domain-containing protein n=1 Tax=Pyranulibacter aquaticus TaxID=3163344 RepID=UPI0035952A0E
MNTKLLSFLLLLFFSNSLFSQKELSFDFDYAKFNYNRDTVYMEFYYSLNPRDMVLKKAQSGYLFDAIVHIEIKNLGTNEYLLNKDWSIKSVVEDTTTNYLSKNLMGLFGILIPRGKYSVVVSAKDKENESLNKIINEVVVVEPYSSEKYSISDIELASNIKTDGADPNSLFYKNTYEVIPNPTMVFTNHSPVMFYYDELYNLKLTKPEQKFRLDKFLVNSLGKTIYQSFKYVNQSDKSVVDVGVINLSKYPTDSYTLLLSLVDTVTNQAFVSSKRFYLYNPNVVDTTQRMYAGESYISSEFAVMTAQECDKMFDEAKYIATKKEIEQYSKIDSLNGKREFLFKFWKVRDTNPETPQNEFKEEYMRRVEYANKHFGYANREGYKSDRGRVYLLYGEPDQKDFFPNEPNVKPYETWYYNSIEGGVIFNFGDLTGFNNYQLLNSTKKGEIQDPNWMQQLTVH